MTIPTASGATVSRIPDDSRGSRLLLLALVAVYLVAFHLSYVTSVAPRWGYSGFIYLPAEDGSLQFAFVAAWFPAAFLPIEARRPSDVILWLLYATAYVPAILVPYYVLSNGWGTFPLTATLISAMGLLLLAQRYTSGRLNPPIRLSDSAYGWAVVVLSLALAAYVVSAFGLSLTLPNLTSVYDVRSGYVDALAESGHAVAYVIGWLGLGFAPLLLAHGIASRRIYAALAGIALTLLVYSTAGYKNVLFMAPLVVGLTVALRYRPRIFGLLLPTSLTLMIGAALLLDELLDSILPSSLAIRRLLDVPGLLTASYYDFFSTHQTYALSASVLHGLIPQPYPVSPPTLIGSIYADGASANGNLWADGIANFGLAGALMATLVAIVVLKLFDAVARDRPLHVAGAVLGAASLSLTNSGILTSLLTHGLAVAGILVLFMLPVRPERAASTAAGSRTKLRTTHDRASYPLPHRVSRMAKTIR